MDDSQFSFVITFSTEFGTTKQVRISGANPELTLAELETPIDNMITASIFDHATVGRLTSVKALVKEEVKHTVYNF